MQKITDADIWQKLSQHYQENANVKMCDLFAEDPKRFDEFSLKVAGLFLDYSKNRITSETMNLLEQLTAAANLTQHIEQMFGGGIVNTTEQRAVLHTVLRSPDSDPEIHATLKRMYALADAIREGKRKGFSKKAFTDIVNIGIGGSDLGPAMVIAALTPYTSSKLNYHFVSNVDGTHIAETLKHLNPETTLFIIASKTFTTQETLCNANTAREWLEQKMSVKDVAKHLLAVTAKPERAVEFGIDAESVYPFWDWVGGRYSLWSAIGISIVIAIGPENFQKLLAGAHAMDDHFHHAKAKQNMPIILALLSIWNNDFLGAKTQAILPYDQYLYLLPSYLQQLEMESNGKRVMLDGTPVTCATSPIIWGAAGTNGQHAFHQLLMQGTQMVPADFIVPLESHNPLGQHHLFLFANCLAQSQALMQGRSEAEIIKELIADGMDETAAKKLAPHKVVPGNIPSNTITMNKVTPETLGALIALYEHKVFVQGVIWGINSFDQWGVELGKQLTKNIIPTLQNGQDIEKFDVSTQGLIGSYLNHH